MPRLSEPPLAPSGDRASASRKSHRHRHHSHSSQSTPRSAQSYNYHAMSSDGDASGQDQTNGHQQPRREEANVVFADFQYYDPQPSARAGEVVEPGMLIRATSSVEYMAAVAESSAIAYLYREGDDMPVLNGTTQATARIVDPDPDIDAGVVEGTVTVQYEWQQLCIHQAGTYIYRIVISGKADDDEAVGLGVYDSERIEVSD
ncbi:hypothetical protein CONLIGDRAFT_640103 [Coniochaeta ligniaria NRRL 30616]|uniref:Uncharacterized protein n=1 Tax=Coniochaeta ligniaria NRRL 30616 TaxID=1408157 RepID=A0A1J7IYW6_9PEZI|nr:hypothetical protein CONLIGDRAFT_640103 [Coniochaeta ligniaria NRRL 30616]